MTGYGRGQSEEDGRRFVVEIKSVNHRYNDISVKLPRMMLAFEDLLRKLVSKSVLRGKTDVYVNFESFSKEDVSVKFNEALGDNLYDVLNTIKNRYKLDGDIGLGLLTRFSDVISVHKEINETDLSDQGLYWKVLSAAAEEALLNFMVMRKKEGAFLKEDMLLKLANIEDLIKKISIKAPAVAMEYTEKLTQRLTAFLEGKVDENRILTEAAIFADKCSIDEELTRFNSHIVQMKQFLNEEHAIGRKLDFLVQEMNREANTISSKSNDVTITGYAVLLKNEIEKIREQVQNIE